jgi:hypothetical protein
MSSRSTPTSSPTRTTSCNIAAPTIWGTCASQAVSCRSTAHLGIYRSSRQTLLRGRWELSPRLQGLRYGDRGARGRAGGLGLRGSRRRPRPPAAARRRNRGSARSGRARWSRAARRSDARLAAAPLLRDRSRRRGLGRGCIASFRCVCLGRWIGGGAGGLEALERQLQLFDLALDLLRTRAEALLLEPSDGDLQRLHQGPARLAAVIPAISARRPSIMACSSAGSSGRVPGSFAMVG